MRLTGRNEEQIAALERVATFLSTIAQRINELPMKPRGRNFIVGAEIIDEEIRRFLRVFNPGLDRDYIDLTVAKVNQEGGRMGVAFNFQQEDVTKPRIILEIPDIGNLTQINCFYSFNSQAVTIEVIESAITRFRSSNYQELFRNILTRVDPAISAEGTATREVEPPRLVRRPRMPTPDEAAPPPSYEGLDLGWPIQPPAYDAAEAHSANPTDTTEVAPPRPRMPTSSEAAAATTEVAPPIPPRPVGSRGSNLQLPPSYSDLGSDGRPAGLQPPAYEAEAPSAAEVANRAANPATRLANGNFGQSNPRQA